MIGLSPDDRPGPVQLLQQDNPCNLCGQHLVKMRACIVQLVLQTLSTAEIIYCVMEVKCCGGPEGNCFLVALLTGAHFMIMQVRWVSLLWQYF